MFLIKPICKERCEFRKIPSVGGLWKPVPKKMPKSSVVPLKGALYRTYWWLRETRHLISTDSCIILMVMVMTGALKAPLDEARLQAGAHRYTIVSQYYFESGTGSSGFRHFYRAHSTGLGPSRRDHQSFQIH